MSKVSPRRFRMVDRVVEVRTNVTTFRDVMDRLLAPFASAGSDVPSLVYEVRTIDDPTDRRRYELLRDGETVGRVSSIGLLMDLLVRGTTNEVVSTTRRYVAIHAAAAAYEGRAVIMPGPAGHGKTTTVAGLVRRGWDFLTDEAVLISLEDGLVHAFPRPLSISPGSIELLPGLKERIPAMRASYRHYDHHVAPEDLRPGCLSGPVPAAFIVFPAYARGAATALAPISRAEALLELLKGTFNLDLLGQKGVAMLAGVVERAPCYRLSIGAIEPAVRAIDGLLRAAGTPAP
ncbi:MAG TPA: hypothetical protein VFZ75_11870 [Actinomycetota bacterium]|nr:hypothetical protein [Actinomycetota bacterium]